MNLRLLLLEECNRNCPGCCNKNWDLKTLPTCTSFNGYDMIMLTGGEPMLRPSMIYSVVTLIREQTSCPIYLYTAKIDNLIVSLAVLNVVDGMTLTLHTQNDVEPFEKFNNAIQRLRPAKSLRLNVFSGVTIDHLDCNLWKIKHNIVWIEKCPLPKDEIFLRMERSKV